MWHWNSGGWHCGAITSRFSLMVMWRRKGNLHRRLLCQIWRDCHNITTRFSSPKKWEVPSPMSLTSARKWCGDHTRSTAMEHDWFELSTFLVVKWAETLHVGLLCPSFAAVGRLGVGIYRFLISQSASSSSPTTNSSSPLECPRSSSTDQYQFTVDMQSYHQENTA